LLFPPNFQSTWSGLSEGASVCFPTLPPGSHWFGLNTTFQERRGKVLLAFPFRGVHGCSKTGPLFSSTSSFRFYNLHLIRPFQHRRFFLPLNKTFTSRPRPDVGPGEYVPFPLSARVRFLLVRFGRKVSGMNFTSPLSSPRHSRRFPLTLHFHLTTVRLFPTPLSRCPTRRRSFDSFWACPPSYRPFPRRGRFSYNSSGPPPIQHPFSTRNSK